MEEIVAISKEVRAERYAKKQKDSAGGGREHLGLFIADTDISRSYALLRLLLPRLHDGLRFSKITAKIVETVKICRLPGNAFSIR